MNIEYTYLSYLPAATTAWLNLHLTFIRDPSSSSRNLVESAECYVILLVDRLMVCANPSPAAHPQLKESRLSLHLPVHQHIVADKLAAVIRHGSQCQCKDKWCHQRR